MEATHQFLDADLGEQCIHILSSGFVGGRAAEDVACISASAHCQLLVLPRLLHTCVRSAHIRVKSSHVKIEIMLAAPIKLLCCVYLGVCCCIPLQGP